MILEQGILRPRPIGRKVNSARPRHKDEGISVNRIQRLLQTGKPHICIIRSLGGIGDVLMTTPLLRALKRKWPDSHITYATDFQYMDGALRDILLYNPYIDELTQFQIAKSKEYDLKVDITSVCIGTEVAGVRGVPNRIDLFARHVGVSLDETGFLPVYIVSEEEKEWAKQKLSRYPRRTPKSLRIGIQARSSTMSRSWPLDRVRDLAVRLANEQGAQVVVFDSSHGNGPQEDWNISGIIGIKDYKIRQVAALINEMDLMVTPDSGLMHIAGALNKKIVTIWAGSDPASRINHYPNAVAIARTNYTCFPCWYNPGACSKSYLCIKSITVDEMFNIVARHLGAPALTFDTETIAEDIVYLRRDIGGYGDIVCMTSAAADLKKRKPEIRIRPALPKKYHCIFENNPDIDECIDLEETSIVAGSRIYDLSRVDSVSEVAELGRTGRIETTRPQVYLKTVDGRADGNIETYVPRLYVTDTEREQVLERFLGDREKKYILTALSSAEEYRNWPYESYFKVFSLAEKEREDWRFVVCNPQRFEEQPPSNVIDASGFSFRKTIILTSMADCVLTPDTSVLHVAGAFRKPCVALFGPIDSEIRCKYYKETTPIVPKLDCVPCWRNGTIPCKRADKGKGNQSFCLLQITPEMVFEALKEKLL
jgi:heptosyltransferase-2